MASLAPFDSTPGVVARRMLALAGVKPGELVVDVGCGDGSILVEAAKMRARAVGVDLNPELVASAKAAALARGVDHRVQPVVGDFSCINTGRADVVTLYLTTDGNRRVLNRLLSQPGKKLRVVSHDFEVKGLNPWKVCDYRYTDFDVRRIYCYKVARRRQDRGFQASQRVKNA